MEIRAPIVFTVVQLRQPVRGDCLEFRGQCVEVVESVPAESAPGAPCPRWTVAAVRPRVLA
jgi:hypothetical protein